MKKNKQEASEMFWHREPKYYLTLTRDELRVVLNSLIKLKNALIREGRYTDIVDEVILKVSRL
jgi:hypothetical protein